MIGRVSRRATGKPFESDSELSTREVVHAWLYAIATFGGFLWQAMWVVSAPQWITPNQWRRVTAIVFIFAVCNLWGFVWRTNRLLGLAYVALVCLGLSLYIAESSDAIANYHFVAGPIRLSQLILPLATVFLGVLLWRDQRFPRLLSYLAFLHAGVWFCVTMFHNNVSLQVRLGFHNDICALLSGGANSVWLCYLALIGRARKDSR